MNRVCRNAEPRATAPNAPLARNSHDGPGLPILRTMVRYAARGSCARIRHAVRGRAGSGRWSMRALVILCTARTTLRARVILCTARTTFQACATQSRATRRARPCPGESHLSQLIPLNPGESRTRINLGLRWDAEPDGGSAETCRLAGRVFRVLSHQPYPRAGQQVAELRADRPEANQRGQHH